MDLAFNLAIAALASYLLGSFSPGYFFGRWIKGIDIRNFGNFNTGATNTYQFVGPFWGVLAGILDILKGSAAFLLANSLLGVPGLAFVVSLFAIVGHNAPFYLSFRGGHGTSTIVGIIAASLFFTQSLFAAAVAALLVFRIIATSPYLKIEKPARNAYRLAGFLFPACYWWFGQVAALQFTFWILVLSLAIDLTRLFSPTVNKFFFKKGRAILKQKERHFVSTTTMFLVSALLTILFFSKEIAIIAMVYFLVGDAIARIYGSTYHRWRVGRKSIEGSLWFFTFTAFFGIYLSGPLGVSFWFAVKGAVFAALVDLASQKIDDNLTIPVGTALLLRFLG